MTRCVPRAAPGLRLLLGDWGQLLTPCPPPPPRPGAAQLHLVSVLEPGLPNDVVGESTADSSLECKPNPEALARTQELLRRCRGEAEGAGLRSIKATTLVSCTGGSADMVGAVAGPCAGSTRCWGSWLLAASAMGLPCARAPRASGAHGVAPAPLLPQGRKISAFSEAEGADLLVLGSRGMGGVKRAFMGLVGLGSVSDYVTRHACTNVVVHKMALPKPSPP
jgi:hypothetical protein